jgi:hypothetical protein
MGAVVRPTLFKHPVWSMDMLQDVLTMSGNRECEGGGTALHDMVLSAWIHALNESLVWMTASDCRKPKRSSILKRP